MIKCISYWSLEGGIENTCTVEQAYAQAKEAGFAGIELAVGENGVLTPSTDRATCERYRATADKHGVVLQTLASGMSWGCSPTSPDEQVRRHAIELHKGALHRAAWLGVRAMLFVPGAVKIPWDPAYGPVRYEQAVEWARQAVTELVQLAENLDIDLCVENVWNGLFYSPIEFASFIDGLKSPRLGIYFDVGNVLGYQQHPPHWIEYLGRRIRRVHIKDFKTSVGNLSGFCDLLAGDVPWKQTMRALRTIGYDQTIVAEMMPPDPTLLQRTSAAMDQILSM